MQRARSGHAEVEPAALVVIGIDENLKPIGVGALIAPRQASDNRIRVRVVESSADVQRRVVIRDVDDRAFARRGPFHRIALGKSGNPLGRLPERLTQQAIDGHGLAAVQANGANLRRRDGWCRRRRW